MADPIDVGWCLSVTFRGRLCGQTTMTTFNYAVAEIEAGPVPSNVLAITDFNTAIVVAGNLKPDYMDAMPQNYELVAIDYQWIVPLRYRKQTILFGDFGTNEVDAETANLAGVFTLHGERAGRRFIANKHLPGLAGADVANGILGGPQLARLTAVKTQALANVVGGGVTWVPVIYGRYIAPYTKCGVAKPGQPQLLTTVTGGDVWDTVRVMRRRTVGVGI